MVRQANETLNGYAALEPLGWLRGYAAFRAESLWLSVRHLEIVRVCLDGLAAKRIARSAESRRLSAREAAQPQTSTPLTART